MPRNRLHPFYASLLVGLCVTATPAWADDVVEVEPNNTQATAQVIPDAAFTLEADADIESSTTIPHVTVQASQADLAFDWFSFSILADGTLGIFDLDYGGQDQIDFTDAAFDGFLDLFDSTGTRLMWNNDMGQLAGAGGSVSLHDPYLQYTFADAGTYFIRVGNCCAFLDDGAPPYVAEPGANLTGIAGGGGNYELQISLQAPGNSPVPEPSTWAMMLLGFGGVGFAFRRRKQAELIFN